MRPRSPSPGRRLESGKSYFWKVKAWDRDGRESAWSAVAHFDTGLFARSDWQGIWIGRKSQLRKEFTLKGRVKRARADVSGLGCYELRLNGRKAGNHVLDPGWTTYDKRVLYATYDITSFLRDGANAVAVTLGHGWYKSRVLLLQVNIEMEDGTTVSVVSDASWKAADGPIVEDSIYNGETYDARRETAGWERTGFDDKDWPAVEALKGPTGVLSAQLMPAIQVVDTIVPLKMSSPLPGVYVFDMGQNFSGWARLRVQGPRGTDVRMRFAELLYEDGTLNQENLRSARAEDHYILKGEGDETWEPRFTYHGFRYVEVTGFPGRPGSTPSAAASSTPRSSRSAASPLQGHPQRPAADHHLGPEDQPPRHPHRLQPARRAHGLAGRRPRHGRGSHPQLRHGRLLHQLPARHPRRAGRTARSPTPCLHVWGRARPTRPGAAPTRSSPGTCTTTTATAQSSNSTTTASRRWSSCCGQAEDGIVEWSNYGDWVAIVEGRRGDLFRRSTTTTRRDPGRRGPDHSDRPDDARPTAALPADPRRLSTPSSTTRRPATTATARRRRHAWPLYLGIADAEGGAAAGRPRRATSSHPQDAPHHRHFGIKYLLQVLTRRGTDSPTTSPTPHHLPELGLHARTRRHDAVGAVAEGDRRGMNSHNHPMFGSVGRLDVPALAGINAGPEGGAGYRAASSFRAADGAGPDPRLGLDDDRSRRGRLRLVADGADGPRRGHGPVRVRGRDRHPQARHPRPQGQRRRPDDLDRWRDFIVGAPGVTGAVDKDRRHPGPDRRPAAGVFVLEGD